MNEIQISTLSDLKVLRTAPKLNQKQVKYLFKELIEAMKKAEWFTIGIMAESAASALISIRQIEDYFSWSRMQLTEKPEKEGPVFLKANQNTGNIHIRIEHGLGEGILISGQHSNPENPTYTWGPLPLDFFDLAKERTYK